MDGKIRRARTRWVALSALFLLLGIPASVAQAGPPGFAFVEVGSNHSCALRADGTVWCWGSRANGNLGDGIVGGYRAVPVQVRTRDGALTGVVQLSVGNQHTCAVKANGTAWCWGRNDYGQTGIGYRGSHQPLAVRMARGSEPLRGIRQVSVNGLVSLALRSDGSVLCWGGADLGQCADGHSGLGVARTVPVTVRTDDGVLRHVSSITAGGGTHCALQVSGTAWCWGWNEWGGVGDGTAGADRLVAVRVRDRDGEVLTRITAIAAGEQHTCAIRSAGRLWCWGGAGWGQVGDGGRGGADARVLVPAQVRLGDGTFRSATAVNIYHSSCAVRSDGSAWCWGDGAVGQLGDGTTGAPGTKDRVEPVQVRLGDGYLTDVVGISTQLHHSCAVRISGSVWCWGENGRGQLGDGTTVGPQLQPVKVAFP